MQLVDEEAVRAVVDGREVVHGRPERAADEQVRRSARSASNPRTGVRLAAVVHGRDVCTPCWDSMNEEDATPADVPYAFPGTGWLCAAVDKCVIKRLYSLKHSARVLWTHLGAVGA